MFKTDKPGAPGTGVGWLLSVTPSISSKLEAESVLTSNTFWPQSAKCSATAVDREVLPTPPLPVKKRCLVGCFSKSNGFGVNQTATFSWAGMPPLWTRWPSIVTAGVA